LKPGREGEAKRIFDKWGLDAAVIGRTTNTGKLTLRWHGQIVCDLPLGPLADEAPKYERPYVTRKISSPHPKSQSDFGKSDSARREAAGGGGSVMSAANDEWGGAPPSVSRSALDSSPAGGGAKFSEAVSKLMSCPDMASKRWIWEQYDRDVMTNTIADSGAD